MRYQVQIIQTLPTCQAIGVQISIRMVFLSVRRPQVKSWHSMEHKPNFIQIQWQALPFPLDLFTDGQQC